MKNRALIVETRPLPNLIEIIQERHMKFLPESFEPLVFCSTENMHMLYDNKIPYTVLGEKNIDWVNYNRLLTNSDFWKIFLDYNRVLVFQHDSEILRTGIEEFMEYDYVGAPIYNIQFPVMNGGLSLRNPRLMYEICKQQSYNGMSIDGNEDVYFCNKLKNINAKIPDIETAKLFSVETIFGLGSLGVHAINKWHTEEKCNLIRSQYAK